MAITATIKEIKRVGIDDVQVSVDFSDGNHRDYVFSSAAAKTAISAQIKTDIDSMNAIDTKLSTYQNLINTVIS